MFEREMVDSHDSIPCFPAGVKLARAAVGLGAEVEVKEGPPFLSRSNARACNEQGNQIALNGQRNFAGISRDLTAGPSMLAPIAPQSLSY